MQAGHAGMAAGQSKERRQALLPQDDVYDNYIHFKLGLLPSYCLLRRCMAFCFYSMIDMVVMNESK